MCVREREKIGKVVDTKHTPVMLLLSLPLYGTDGAVGFSRVMLDLYGHEPSRVLPRAGTSKQCPSRLRCRRSHANTSAYNVWRMRRAALRQQLQASTRWKPTVVGECYVPKALQHHIVCHGCMYAILSREEYTA